MSPNLPDEVCRAKAVHRLLKMNARSFVKSILFAGIALLMCLLCASCGEEQVYVRQSSGEIAAGLKEAQRSAVKGGVAITFDDASIDEWYSILDLLDKYDAKVTFFVTHWDKLDSEQIRKLKVLQNAGHEIGCHGLTHKSLNDYESSTKGLVDYMKEEIFPAINIMVDNGFMPLNFAYVKGWLGASPIKSHGLLLQYFHYVRVTHGVAPSKIPDEDLLYHKCGSNRRDIRALGIEDGSNCKLEDIQAGLRRAAERDEIMVFYAHIPSDEPGINRISIARLEAILKTSSELGLNFYRVQDLLNCCTN